MRRSVSWLSFPVLGLIVLPVLADEPAPKKPAAKSSPEKKSEKSAPEKATGKATEKDPAKKTSPKPKDGPVADLAPPGTKVSLAFSVPQERKLLVSRIARMEGVGKISGGALPKPMEMPVKIEDELQLLDEQIPSKTDRGEGVRKILKWKGQTNGDITDSPYAGVEILYATGGDGRELSIKNDRQYSQQGANDLLRLGLSFGLWLALPKEAMVGKKYEIDAMPLAPLLTSGDIPPTLAKATCTFESFDRTTGIGTLRGPIEMEEKGEKEGRALSAKYHGECVIRISPGESRIVSLKIQGTCEMAAEQKTPAMRVESTGKLTVDVTSQIGDAAAKASANKVPPRDRIQNVEALGLKMKLPGHYERMFSNGAPQFLRTLDASKGQAVIVASFIREKASNAKAFFDGVLAGVKKLDPNVKTEKVKCFLGEGKAYVLETGEKEARQKLRSEIYPVMDGVWLMFKLSADPRQFPAAEKEFIKARSTLANLK